MMIALAAAAIAATYTAPTPQGSRSDRATNRYATPVAGLMRVDTQISDFNDGDTALEAALAGYLQRVVFSADGNDTSWTLSILDANDATIFTASDCNMAAGTYSYAARLLDVDGTAYGGVPFDEGLTIRIADANGGDGNTIDVRLYISESWRR